MLAQYGRVVGTPDRCAMVASQVPPLVYVWGVPGLPVHLAGAQLFTVDLAAYLATHHNVTVYKLDHVSTNVPFLVPVNSPLNTLACVASHMPPQVERQRAKPLLPGGVY